MTDARLELILKSYENPNAIENVINYICRIEKKTPYPLYCYGAAPSPSTPIVCRNTILAFYAAREHHRLPSQQQLWHFVISFAIPFPYIEQKHFIFADAVAFLFSKEYQSCYAYHSDTAHPHFHFVVSATSYIPDYPSLDKSNMDAYISQIIQLAAAYSIKLSVTEKR